MKIKVVVALAGCLLSTGVAAEPVVAESVKVCVFCGSVKDPESQQRIGIPKGETFEIISPVKKSKCRRIFTWDKPPRVVKKICKPKAKRGR